MAGGIGARAAAPANFVVLSGQVVPHLTTMRDAGALAPDTELNVEIMLQRDDAAVARYEASLYDPHSAGFHKWLTPTQFDLRFGAPGSVVAQMRSFATAQGLSVVNAGATGNNLVVLHGSAAQVEQTFAVSLHRYQDAATGRTFYANAGGATVPAGLGIQAVLGLENYHQVHLASMGGGGGGPVPVSEPSCAGAGSQNVCYGLLGPQDLWSVYHTPEGATGNQGQGQTIAVIGEGESADVIQALREYETSRGLPKVPVQVYHSVPYNDTPGKADDAGRVEWEMDTQSSTTMAPHVEQVRLYFGNDLSLSTLATTVQTWASDPHGSNQASASLGACEEEFALDQLGGLADQASSRAFAQAALEGRTFFASAGDTGAGCAVGPAGVNGVTYGPLPSPEFPSIDPNVTGVGGTVVYTDGSGGRLDEHAWEHGGGTRSEFVPQPSYQSSVPLLQTQFCPTQENGTPYTTPTLCRASVDVSALSGDATIVVQHEANHNGPQYTQLPGPYPYPLAGMFVANGFDMVDTGDQGASYSDHFSEGGTSLSSPLWLGMWARVNAAAAKPLGQANYTMYPMVAASATSNAFHDIIEGGNPLPTLPGWDFPTGLGSPDVTLITKYANNGNTKAVNPVEPSGPDPKPIDATLSGPSCATFTNTPGKASSANLDIIEGDLSPSADAKSLRVSLTLSNMSENFPTGMDDMTYNVFWNPVKQSDTDKTTNYTATQAEIKINPGGTPTATYSDGTMNVDSVQGTTTYTPANTATGAILDGSAGRVEVDVPLADIGSPAVGTHLTAIQAQTAESASTIDPTGQATTTGFGLIQDSAAASTDYVVGSPSCLDQPGVVVPEAPLGLLLPLFGAASIGGGLGLRRLRLRRTA
ncbi:MAG TPA: S53 family peptidase [Candidatus Angelobacter sp.]|jgi:pseudomonalisin|nr:S53 family peptidase [Candidatus Angelobacter sp.]